MFGENPRGNWTKGFTLPVVLSWLAAAALWWLMIVLSKDDGLVAFIFFYALMLLAIIIMGPLLSMGFDSNFAVWFAATILALGISAAFILGVKKREPILTGLAGHAAISAIGFALFFSFAYKVLARGL